ncbi:MAG: prepilin-type N-terminal cleavage/methylation domain-containing protein [Desulfohalobium sp.]
MDPQRRAPVTPRSGFTLLEVLVAIALLSVGILAWALTQNQQIQGRAESGHMTTATELAQSLIETKAATASGWKSTHPDSNGTLTQELAGFMYTAAWRIQGANGTIGSAGKSLWRVECNVSWEHYTKRRVVLERMVVGR